MSAPSPMSSRVVMAACGTGAGAQVLDDAAAGGAQGRDAAREEEQQYGYADETPVYFKDGGGDPGAGGEGEESRRPIPWRGP